MAALGAVICQAIVHHYGRDEFLRRLLHPFGHRTAAIAERLLPLGAGFGISDYGSQRRSEGDLWIIAEFPIGANRHKPEQNARGQEIYFLWATISGEPVGGSRKGKHHTWECHRLR